MRPTGQLSFEERLSPDRVARRWAGAGAVVLITVLDGLAAQAALASRARAGLGAALAANPELTVGLGLGLGVVACAAAIALTWLPQRHRFHVVRASVHVVSGRRARRHALSEVGLSSDPPTLHVGGREYLIHADDHRRLAGLLRVAVPLRSRHARPVAQSNPTVIAERRRRVRKVRRHPTLV